jgi:hypothetical protein
MGKRPSPAAGLRHAAHFRKLVFAVWLVSVVVFVPAQAVVQFATGTARANLPDGPLPPGDELLMLYELLGPVVAQLVLALIGGAVALVAWSVLWHAGTVRWFLWNGGNAPVQLAEVLGHGVVWWWRYLRLALTAAAMLATVLFVVWLPLDLLMPRVETVGSAGRVVALLWIGVGASLIAGAVCWLATLRGAWLLGEAGRRSAIVAWLRGLAGTVRRPVRSGYTLLLWAVPALVFQSLPLTAGLVLPPLPGGGAGSLVAGLATFLAAFCWVGLLLSFSPEDN